MNSRPNFFKITINLFLVWLLAFSCGLSRLVSAEVLTGADDEIRDWIMGRSLEELKVLLGPPDGKDRSKKKGFVTWRYGKSSVYFQNSLAVAYLDRGELRVRKLARPGGERRLRKARDFRKQGWENPWTRSQISQKKVLEGILP